MKLTHLTQPAHLTYCTNIHPGESWSAVFKSLQHSLAVKKAVAPNRAFGIGLRLSNRASKELNEGTELQQFRQWLKANDCYVFTMNGFPYGGFHHQVVKDQVHAPDWTTKKRVNYTKRLFDQLAYLLPDGMAGGISTSPISYRFWHPTLAKLRRATARGARNICKVVAHLHQLEKSTGKRMHLDIEPEPDGILENSEEFINFYEDILLPTAVEYFAFKKGWSAKKARRLVRRYVQLCYDVCHFAVAYERPKTILKALKEKKIKVGKIQISAAIRAALTTQKQRNLVRISLQPYNESTYLHQTVMRCDKKELEQFPDLEPALAVIEQPKYTELRTHFHVPIFTDSYGVLASTNNEIVDTLRAWSEAPFSQHLEVETYTWEVLPDKNRLTLDQSIARELEWVLSHLSNR